VLSCSRIPGLAARVPVWTLLLWFLVAFSVPNRTSADVNTLVPCPVWMVLPAARKLAALPVESRLIRWIESTLTLRNLPQKTSPAEQLLPLIPVTAESGLFGTPVQDRSCCFPIL